MNLKFITFPLIIIAAIAAFTYYFMPPAMTENDLKPADMPAVPEGHQQITLGAGCFWCVEAIYNRIDGIKSAVSGYTGGHTENPTYADICAGGTGHNEVVHLVYDPEIISTEEILDYFWQLHNPTTLNRQGNDIGDQYRSGIYYHTDEQLKIARQSLENAQSHFQDPIVTEIEEITTFHPAEVGHQDYYRLNGNRNPYCRATIPPKLKKLGLEDKPKVAE